MARKVHIANNTRPSLRESATIDSSMRIVLLICLVLMAMPVFPQEQPAPDLRQPLSQQFTVNYVTLRPLPELKATETIVEYPSPFTSGDPNNDRVHGWWLTPDDKPAFPVVVLLHSLGIRQPTFELSIAHELVRNGIGVLMLTLPYHMKRTPAGTNSGELMISSDVKRLVDGMTQAVWDVRRAIDWLERDPRVQKDKIGLAGISLGAIVGGTTLAVEPRIHSAALILGGVDLAHIIWQSALTIRARIGLRNQGYSLDRLREELKPIDAMHMLNPELGAKTFVIGARYDIIVPSEDTRKLISALGNPQVLWLDTGHFGGALVQRPLFRVIRRFFESRFEFGTASVPDSFLAPTLRIGMIYSPNRDLRVALGTDLWRSNSRGDFYVSLVLTPKGSSLFSGVSLRGGFSLGAEITPKRAYGALFWNFVL